MLKIKNIFNLIRTFFITIIITLLVLGMGALAAFLLFENIYYVGETEVPQVTDISLEAAQEKLYKANLKISISAEEFNDKLPRNYIIKQEPEAGTKVKQNREIRVILSKGAEKLILNIPDVRYKDLEEAINIIKDNGFKVGKIAYASHFSISKNKVISQSPEPGMITSNNNINLLVSSGNY